MLMSNDPLTYQIDQDDVITEIDGGWDEFALSNAGEKALRSQMLGTKLFSSIQNAETISLYQQINDEVRATGDPVSLPFRCDSPECKRLFQLSVLPTEHDGLTFHSRMHSDVTRLYPLHVLSREREHDGLSIPMCSICKCIQAYPPTWSDLDEGIRSLNHINPPYPKLHQTICPDCAQSISECRHLLSVSNCTKRNTRYGSALIVHLQSLADYWIQYNPHVIVGEEKDYMILSPFTWQYEPDPIDFVRTRIEETLEKHSINQDKIYLIGYEEGAVFGWQLLESCADIFAGAVLINGYCWPLCVDHVTQCPVWALEENGAILETTQKEQLLHALKERGSPARQGIVSGLYQGSLDLVRNQEDVWEWLLSRRLSQ